MLAIRVNQQTTTASLPRTHVYSACVDRMQAKHLAIAITLA